MQKRREYQSTNKTTPTTEPPHQSKQPETKQTNKKTLAVPQKVKQWSRMAQVEHKHRKGGALRLSLRLWTRSHNTSPQLWLPLPDHVTQYGPVPLGLHIPEPSDSGSSRVPLVSMIAKTSRTLHMGGHLCPACSGRQFSLDSTLCCLTVVGCRRLPPAG